MTDDVADEVARRERRARIIRGVREYNQVITEYTQEERRVIAEKLCALEKVAGKLGVGEEDDAGGGRA